MLNDTVTTEDKNTDVSMTSLMDDPLPLMSASHLAVVMT